MRDDPGAPRMLRRIARALNVPTETFYAHDAAGSALDAGGPTVEELRQRQGLDLLRMFLALDDPTARERCLAYVRSELARHGG